jgi:hypothetical protein
MAPKIDGPPTVPSGLLGGARGMHTAGLVVLCTDLRPQALGGRGSEARCPNFVLDPGGAGKGKGGHPAWQRVLVAGEGAALVGAVHVS